MFKKPIVYFICLTLSVGVSAQDTITFAELSAMKNTLNGHYVVIEEYKNIITAFEFNGEYIVDTIKGKTPYYQVGQFVSGKKHGIWKMFISGATHDTLFGEWLWNHDTVMRQTSFYRTTATPDIVRTYNQGFLINESYYLPQGTKYIEYDYLFCMNRDTNYNCIITNYHSNGFIKSTGKFRADYSTKYKKQDYGISYYFTRKGKLWKTINHDNNITTRIRRPGKQYEWYNKKY